MQARTLFGYLGYPPEKADFHGRPVKLDEFIFYTNGRKNSGAFGREDFESVYLDLVGA